MEKMIMKHKRGVIRMIGVKYEKKDCPCLSCMYLIQATKINEELDGSYDLKINCSITGCPKGFFKKNATHQSSEAFLKISNCIEMLKRCIELKSKGGVFSE